MTGENERMNEQFLKEEWHFGEEIDSKGIYKKVKYRKVERIGFYIRPLREWFFPCKQCQEKLKKQMAEGNWVLGNKEYEPDIELNNTKMEIDEDSFVTLEERKATNEEIERIGLDGYEDLE
jgi:hypothetical protein